MASMSTVTRLKRKLLSPGSPAGIPGLWLPRIAPAGKAIRAGLGRRTMGRIAILAIVLALLIGSASVVFERASWASAETANLGILIDDNGREIIEVIVNGKPPRTGASTATATVTGTVTGGTVLSNVPAFDWSYGCSATAAAMLFGYYDRIGYSNMYTGATNGGVCPLDNTVWGQTAYAGVTCNECPLSATHLGVDGRSTKGSVDDYWIDYGNAAPDPYIGQWTEHTQGDAIGDFMGTNQSKFSDPDGSTTFYFYPDGSPLYDYAGCEPSSRDGGHGLKLFATSRGYTVTANFSQLIQGYPGTDSSKGFTFADYMAEIDAGRPVLIQVQGHTMLGYGYNTTGNTIYIHDTWDHSDHSMTWGGSYAGMQHYGVTVIRLAGVAAPSLSPTIGSSPSSFTFTATQGGSNPASQTLDIQNTGGGTLSWSVADDATWLSLSPASGTSTGEVDTVAVAANISGMTAGSYSAAISISGSGATNSPRTVSVSLTVSPPSSPLGEAVDNTALSWSTGGSANWFAETTTAYYGGDAAQSGAITHNQFSWLRTTATGAGALTFYWKVSSEKNYDFLRFYIDGVEQVRISGSVGWQLITYSIASGTHTLEWRYTKDRSISSGSDCGWMDRVGFASAAPAAPAIGLSPSSFAFTVVQGGSNEASQALNVQNTGGGTLNWSVTCGAAWLTLSPTSGSSTGEVDSVAVVANTSGMSAGSYSATITISGTGATNTPRTISVSLTATTPSPTIGYSPSSFAFTAILGGANPASQILNIQNAGSGTLSWSVSDAAAWLSLSPASGSSTGETDAVTVSANVSGMSTGSYSATVTISGTGAANTPRTVAVTLTINASSSPLAEAVDNTALSWSTSGNASWFAETTTAYYGGDAAQSGAITHNQSASLTTTVTGAGTLSFYWKVSSEKNYDFLRFYIDGVEQVRISGSVSWQLKTYSIASGTHTLEWRYTKDRSINSGSDCGWLDKVSYIPA